MKTERCPHCGKAGFGVGRLPREVVAIIGCQHCGELSVIFRKKIIPLKKNIIEAGSFEERKEHLADVIAQFLEAGLFSFENQSAPPDGAMFELPETLHPPKRRRKPRKEVDTGDAPISDQELERFVRIDLKCIDNPTYFKRIFG
ncbi:MAG TPA: hypothetical protein ENN29_10445 [Candidatus Hydrogenedentes bacterium]|nr:hypothetical protein [Candidatus Hydrogenedentota bacterium]